MNVITLTKELLSIPSPSGEEKKIGEYLVQRLRGNFEVTLQDIGGRFNILATRGKPDLLLTTHIDTVPGELRVYEDEEWLYGRGACDTKGIIASMICASERAIAEGITNFGLLFDVSEETDFSGIEKGLNLVNPKRVIIGEPTNFDLVIGQKGLLGITLMCEGMAAPGSTPELGESAIEKLMDILARIREARWPSDSVLGKTNFNIGKIEGGVAANVVAPLAQAILEFRTTVPNEEIIAMLKVVSVGAIIQVSYNFERSFLNNIAAFDEFGFKKEVVPYFTEMYFWQPKASSVVFGPGEYCYAHTNNEKIRKRDLVRGEDEYLNMIRTLTTTISKEKLKN